MKIVIHAALAASLAFAPIAASAQNPPSVYGAAAAPAVLRTGTSVPLRTLTELTTNGKMLKVGHRFQMETSEAVTLNGQTIIPAGSPAVGEVMSVRNKGMWGKSGAIEARVLYVTANGRQMRLSGSFDDKGTTGTAGVVGAIVVLPVVGFFVTGTSAKISAGSTVRAFLDEDVPLNIVATAVAPMVIPPAAPAMVVPATPN